MNQRQLLRAVIELQAKVAAQEESLKLLNAAMLQQAKVDPAPKRKYIRRQLSSGLQYEQQAI